MSRRHTNAQGGDYIIRPDRYRVRDTGARLERMRPAGEIPLWLAVCAGVGLCLLVVAFVVVVS